MSDGEYAEKEKEKSDMFLFVKIFCPKLFERYVRIKSEKYEENFSEHSKLAIKAQSV